MVAIGCVIKTPGSSKNNKTGSWRTFKPVLDKEKCKKMGENAHKISLENVEEKIYAEIKKLVK
mgnify:CR=1 FL=1